MSFGKPPFKIERSWALPGNDTHAADDDGPVAFVRHVGALAWHNKGKLIAMTALGLIVAGLYVSTLPKVYKATATLLLETRHRTTVTGQDNIQQDLDLARVDSESEIIRSERLLMTVFEGLQLENSPELAPAAPGRTSRWVSSVGEQWSRLLGRQLDPPADETVGAGGANGLPADLGRTAENAARRIAFQNFSQKLDVRRIGQTYVIAITYTSLDPQVAAAVANAAVSAYLWQTIDFKYQMATAGTEMLQGRLDALSAQIEATKSAIEKGELPAKGTPDGDARIIGAARPPLAPSGASKTVMLALGGLLGLFGGIALTASRALLDRRVREPQSLSKETGLPCLALLPRKPDRLSRLVGYGADAQPEKPAMHDRRLSAMHELRTAVELTCAPIRRDKNIVVALAGWGKDDATIDLGLHLGHLMSRSGRRVALFAGASQGRTGKGPQSSSQGQLSLADVIVTQSGARDLAFSEKDGVMVMPIHSAYAETNLYADFFDARAKTVIEQARVNGDVLMVLPPLQQSGNALALAALADVVLVVVQSGRSNLDDVADLLQRLRRSGANVIGTVIDGGAK